MFYRSHGFQNNLETFALISGLWTSTFALGAFVGPSLSGILYDSIGFRNSSMFVCGVHLILGIVVTLFLFFSHKPPAYVELKEEKLASGEVLGSLGKTRQNSVNESVKR